MKLKKLIFSAVFSLAAFTGQAEEGKKLTTELLTQLNQIHSLAVSPNGDHLVYGVKEGFTGGKNDLYLKNLVNGKEKQLTSHATSERNVVFSDDSKGIYFLSSRSGSAQVWYLPLNGGEAQQISNLPLSINGFVLSKDQKTFAFDITVKPGCENFQCTLDAKSADKNKKHNVKIYDQLMVRHWDVWTTEYKNHLFIARRANVNAMIETATDLMPTWQSDVVGVSDMSFNPNGESIVFGAKSLSTTQAWTTNFDLFEVNLKKQSIENITEANTAWDAKPVFSNNGRYLAYVAMNKPGYESDKFSIKVRDNSTGQVRSIASQWDRSVSELVFANDNRTLYVTAQDVGQKSIFEVHPEFGDVRQIFNQGTNGSIAVTDDKIYFTHHALDRPTDIYTIGRDGYGLDQVTSVNKEKMANVAMAEFQQFNFKGWNDETVHGYWMKPVDFVEGQKYPIAFLVHGGPQGSFGNMFHFRWNAQLWAAQGYGVVMVDFHGSTGYGQAFTDSIARDWGGKPLEDLQKGLNFIADNQPWLDANNACALGASYGGYMMNWIQGNWSDGFNCIINHAGLYDLPSFYGSTEELWFPEHDFGGTVWDAPQDYQKFNPAAQALVANWKTPMLVIQGELDFRVPYAQSLGAFTTLQRKNIPSRLVMFPQEDHHIREPNNLIKWYQEVFNWMKKYTADTQTPTISQ